MEFGLFLDEQLQRCLVRLTVDADVGDGVQPMAARWIEGRPRRQFQPAEEVLFNKLHPIFDAPFFVALSDAASADFEAVMVGEVQIARVKLGGLANGMA